MYRIFLTVVTKDVGLVEHLADLAKQSAKTEELRDFSIEKEAEE